MIPPSPPAQSGAELLVHYGFCPGPSKHDSASVIVGADQSVKSPAPLRPGYFELFPDILSFFLPFCDHPPVYASSSWGILESQCLIPLPVF